MAAGQWDLAVQYKEGQIVCPVAKERFVKLSPPSVQLMSTMHHSSETLATLNAGLDEWVALIYPS